MNRIYRTLWSVATQSWQAVPETAKTAGKKSVKSAAGGVIASVALSFTLNGAANAQAPPAVNQLPTSGTVSRGTATISQTATAQAAAMTVTQSSQRAVVNWSTFNLGQSASINFVQPNAQAVTLNRVNDSSPSQIFGRITANGQVFLTNANGVYFSPTSSVDVGALTATSHSISDDNFMSGKYVFERKGATGKVVNEGNITAALRGYVALLAPEVQNSGVVVARAGTVALAAGEMITLKVDDGGSLASLTTTPSTIATLVENKHVVLAPDGQIILSAVALNKLQAGVIKNSGNLEANSLVNKGGKIYLEGDDITLDRNSTIEAKGPTGGGTVLVGGDWQGSGDLRQATKVTMEAGATIDASATDKGDGGKVVLWSDVSNVASVTEVHGSIKAEAGPQGGDGRQIETSGHVLNVNDAQVSTHAPLGNSGQWLLDPYNITISSGVQTPSMSLNGGVYTTGTITSILNVTSLQTALANGNVEVSTTGAGNQAGDITVNNAISWTTANTLKLSAGGLIKGTGNISIGTGGGLTFNQTGVATNSSAETYQGIISGSGTFTKEGAGTSILTGANTYSGTTTISAGTLQIGNSSITSTLMGTGAVVNNGTLAFNAATTQSFAPNTISGTGAVNVSGSSTSPGTVTLKADNSFSGGITVQSGPRVVAGGSSIGSAGALTSGPFGTGTVTLNSGSQIELAGYNIGNTIKSKHTSPVIYVSTGSSELYGEIDLTTTSSTLVLMPVSGSTLNLTGTLNTSTVDNGTVTKLRLTGAGDVYEGFSSINAGYLIYLDTTAGKWTLGTDLNNAIGLGTKASLYQYGGTFDLAGKNLGTSGDARTTNFAGGTLVNSANTASKLYSTNSYVYSDITISTPNVGGDIYLSTTNYLTGPVTVKTVTKTGLGDLHLRNTYTNAGAKDFNINVQAGNLMYDVTQNVGGFSGIYSLATGSTLYFNASPSIPVTGTITGDGSVVIKSSTALAGSNTYTGGTTVYNGATLTYAKAPVMSGTNITSGPAGTGSITLGDAITSAMIDMTGYNLLPNNLVINGTTTIFSGATGTPVISGTISDGVNTGKGLTLNEGSFGKTMEIQGNNTYTGPTTVTGSGVVLISHSNALGASSSGTTIAGSATLKLKGDITVGESITIGGGSATFGNLSGNNTLTGTYTKTNSTSTISSDAGTLTFTPAAGNAIELGTTALTFTGAGNVSVDGAITGTSSITKLGTGTATLSGNNTYTGAVTLSQGVLRAASSNALGTTTGGITVASGATLELGGPASPGSIAIGAEALTVSDGGAIHNVAGYNTYAGGMTLSGNASITVDTGTRLNFTASGAPAIAIAGNKRLSLYLTDGDLTFAKALSGSAGSSYLKAGGGTLTTGGISGLILVTGVYARLYDPTGNDYSTEYGSTPDYTFGFFDAASGGNRVNLALTSGYTGTPTWSGTAPALGSAAGAYSLTYASGLTVTSNSYALMGAGSATTWTVAPKVVTVTLSPPSATYNGVTTYANLADATTFTTSPLYGADTVTSITKTASSAGVAQAGNYTITPSLAVLSAGATAGNYSFSYPAASATVAKANLTLSGSKTYDGSTAIAGSQLTATGVNSETFAVTGSGANGNLSTANVQTNSTLASVSGLAVGASTGSNVGDPNNYNNLSTTGSTFSVGRATATLSATKTYDGDTSLTGSQFAITGVSIGGTAETLGFTGTATLFDANVATANNYVTSTGLTLTNGTGLASNYVLPAYSYSANNSATLNRATATVTASKTYNGDTSLTSSQVSITGVSVSGVAQVLDYTGTAALSNANVATANKYVNTTGMTLADGSTGLASNYNLPAASYNALKNNATISRLALTATDSNPSSSTYGNALTPGSLSFTNQVAGDDVNGTVTVTVPAGATSSAGVAKAGTYFQSASNVLTGADAGNYSFAGITSSTANYTVNQRTLTGTSIAAVSSEYGSNLTPGAVSFTNVVAGDHVSTTATVDTNTVSQSGKPIVGSYTQTTSTALSGDDASNYVLPVAFTSAANYTISQKSLTISVPGATKVYDGSNAINLSGPASVTGVINLDDVQISAGNVTGFVDKNVGTNKAVIYNGFAFTGTDASNYSLAANPASTADITAKAITVTGITANNKVYNATETASLNLGAAALTSGATTTTDNKIYTGDVVTVDSSSALGTFANANVGTGKTVTITGLALSGNDASNYAVTDASNATANITAKTLTVTGLSAPASRVYNGTQTATVTGTPTLLTAQAAGAGNSADGKPYTGDVIGFTGTANGTYNDKSVAAATTVTFGGLTSNNSNYTFDLGTQAATITQADLALTGVTVQNKTYNATLTAVLAGTPAVNALGVDVVNINAGGASGLFADKNVGTGKTVTVSGYTLGGADGGNYHLIQPTGLTADITKADLQVTGVTAQNKVYDATLSATLTGVATVAALPADVVNVGGTGVGVFADKNVGTAKPVTASGFTISGADASNYNLLQPAGLTADITRATLSLSGITAANKTYDGNNTAMVSVTNAAKTGLYTGDEVNVSATGTFSDKNTGTNQTVTLTSSYSGADVSNYTITDQASATANISAKALGLSIPGASRMYDGTTSISPSGPVTLLGVIGADQLTLGNGTVTGYVDKNVGTNKIVTYTGLALTGVDSGNYTLPAQPTSDATITAAPLTISGITAANKTYDSTTSATVNALQVVKTGLIGNDVVDISVTGAFANKNAGTAKTVNLSSTYTGADAGNYSITDQTTTTADISKASLTVTAANATKLFGNANPTLSVELSGFVGGETLATSGVTGAGVATTTATMNTNPGSAVITPTIGTLAATNYDFTSFVNGTLTINAIAALSNNEVSQLIGSQLAGLTGTQMSSFTATQLQVFSAQQLGSLSSTQLSGLTASQLGSLNGAQLQGIKPAQVALLNAAQISGVTADQLASFSTSQLLALTASQIATLLPAQLSSLSPAQISLLTSNAAASLSPRQILSLSPEQIAAVSLTQVAALTVSELSALSNAQLQALTPLQLASIAPDHFAAFTPQQIMAMSITQVQNLSPEQLSTFTPAQVASISAAELAYFDARQLAAIGIYPAAETPKTAPVAESNFEAPIPVMTAIASPVASVVSPAVSSAPTTAPATMQATDSPATVNTTTPAARTGLLAITILHSTEAKPTTAGVAFEQDADTVSLRVTAAPAVTPLADKVVFTDKLTTFLVATPNGEMVAFEGTLVNNRMVIVAPSVAAKRVARTEMSLVLAAAVTSLGKERRVMLANLTGVVLDLR
jgi:filamentous hemagglutinin family protein